MSNLHAVADQASGKQPVIGTNSLRIKHLWVLEREAGELEQKGKWVAGSRETSVRAGNFTEPSGLEKQWGKPHPTAAG